MRAVLLVAALVALAGPALAEERVLYCTDTAGVGFLWEEGQTEGQVSHFKEDRYLVRVLSETVRIAKRTNIESLSDWLTCKKPYESLQPSLLVCADESGVTTWLFNKNKFVRSHGYGTPVGGDPNIWISYGTCTGF